MSAREFARWRLFHDQYPIDDESVHVVQVAALEARLANLFRDSDKHSAAFAVADFMLASRFRAAANPVPEPEIDDDAWGKRLTAALDRYAATSAPP